MGGRGRDDRRHRPVLAACDTRCRAIHRLRETPLETAPAALSRNSLPPCLAPPFGARKTRHGPATLRFADDTEHGVVNDKAISSANISRFIKQRTPGWSTSRTLPVFAGLARSRCPAASARIFRSAKHERSSSSSARLASRRCGGAGRRLNTRSRRLLGVPSRARAGGFGRFDRSATLGQWREPLRSLHALGRGDPLRLRVAAALPFVSVAEVAGWGDRRSISNDAPRRNPPRRCCVPAASAGRETFGREGCSHCFGIA